MRRLLSSSRALGLAAFASLLGTLGLLAVSASAGFLTKDVHLQSLENATNQTITVVYNDGGGAQRTARLAPGGRLTDLRANGLSLDIPDCGPARLTLTNPLVGEPSAHLGDGGFNDDSSSLAVNDQATVAWRGVRVLVRRARDSAEYKELQAEVLACRATPDARMTPVPETEPERFASRNVRATVHNATAKPIDVGYTDASERWRAVRVERGASTGAFGTNTSDLRLLLSDCGPDLVRLGDLQGVAATLGIAQPSSPPFVDLIGSFGSASATLDPVGDRHVFDPGGNRIIVTREPDSAFSLQFSIDLLDCDGR